MKKNQVLNLIADYFYENGNMDQEDAAKTAKLLLEELELAGLVMKNKKTRVLRDIEYMPYDDVYFTYGWEDN